MGSGATLVQLKAFGDLVIASAAAGRIAPDERAALTLLIGDHLRPLCHAIVPPVEVAVVRTGEAGVPSLFDARRNGPAAMLRSAVQLRRGVAAAAPAARPLVFDRLGWRERWVSVGRRALDLPSSANIYDAYDLLLVRLGFRLVEAEAAAAPLSGSRRVGIFPGSRLAAKNMPLELVREMLHALHAALIPVDLFLLDGERVDLERSGLPYVAVPRDFGTLSAHVRSVDAIVSADSLPAHLAETFGTPVFVLTPRPNLFWMPRSVWRDGRWCVFDADDRLGRVSAFVAHVDRGR